MINTFFIAFIMAFVGLIPPGMLNINACRTSLSQGLKPAIHFSIGAAIVVFLQASIALFFANYLRLHPEIISYLEYAGIVVFFLLSLYFFMQVKKKFKTNKKLKKGTPLLTGIGLSSLNMLSVPYYLIISTFGESKGWISLVFPNTLIFVFGSVFGVFTLLATYSYFAKTIMRRSQFLATNANYILSALFLVLGIVGILQVFG